jgi:hypothetical protein
MTIKRSIVVALWGVSIFLCLSCDSYKQYITDKTIELVNEPIEFREWLDQDSLYRQSYYNREGTLMYSYEDMNLVHDSTVIYDFVYYDDFYGEVRNKNVQSFHVVFENSQNKVLRIVFVNYKNSDWRFSAYRIFDPKNPRLNID